MLDPVLAKTAIQNICNALVAVRSAVRSGLHPQPRRLSRQARRQNRRVEGDGRAAEGREVRLLPRSSGCTSPRRSAWKYFGTIELKPGIDPTARHIEELISSMKAEHVPIVVREPQFPEKVPRLIAEQTGAALVKLPIMPGGVPHTDTYIEMMDYIIHTMVAAAKK